MGHGQKRPRPAGDRRSSNRLPIEQEVRYKVWGRKAVVEAGAGKVLNMSGTGVLFSTESALTKGQQVELAVNWPARLHGVIALNLVVYGPVVRAEKTQAAIVIKRYEFKTAGSVHR